MQISPNHVVSLTYTLRVESGEIVDKADEKSPFAFIHGIGQTLPAFDQNLMGLKVGDAFSFELSAEEGYGEFHEEQIVDIPVSVFNVPGAPKDLLQIGRTIPMQDNDGNMLYGTVQNVGKEMVTMDFNHPLAGEKLHFSGSVLSIRAASEEELDHGHVHGEGGHHH